MTRRPADARARVPGRAKRRRIEATAVACVLAASAGGAGATCLAIDSHPEAMPLSRIALPASDPTFTLRYVHSVTRTPVDEDYRVDGSTIVQTAIRFAQHGPGLPTEADAGASWRVDANGITVTMNRRHETIAMRVHADQAPRLTAAGDARPVELARWGNRALVLSAAPGDCPATNGAAIR